MTDASVKTEAADPALTIDELARRVGMTVRNLREWRALGLLPPPEIRGRTGYYDPGQVQRIERIRELHAEGFPLELIRRLLEASGDAGDEAMRLAGTLRAGFRDERPPLVDLAELERSWGATVPDQLRRAVELGLIRERDDGRHEFTSARVARVGETLRELGLSIDETLEATAAIRAHADGMAEVFQQVWLAHVWQPFVDEGRPDGRWPQIHETLAKVQPLALDAVIGLFGVAMEAKVEAAIADEVHRAAEA